MSNIVLHPHQSRIYYDLFIGKTVRNAVAVCCRGFGKSYLGGATAIGAVFELMELPANVPNKDVVIVAPTYSQVTDVYYDMIMYELGMEEYVLKSSKDTGSSYFLTMWNSSLCPTKPLSVYEVVESITSLMTKPETGLAVEISRTPGSPS